MEALSSILLLLGVTIMWFAKREAKKQEQKKALNKPPESLFKELKQDKTTLLNKAEMDLRNRHLQGVLNESIDEKHDTMGVLKRVERLPTMKKAIIWADILGRPVSES